MAKVTGFLEYGRENTPHRPPEERVRDWHEVQLDPPDNSEIKQNLPQMKQHDKAAIRKGNTNARMQKEHK